MTPALYVDTIKFERNTSSFKSLTDNSLSQWDYHMLLTVMLGSC